MNLGANICLYYEFLLLAIKAFQDILKNKHAIQNIFPSFTSYSKSRPARLSHAVFSSVIHECLLLLRKVQLENTFFDCN